MLSPGGQHSLSIQGSSPQHSKKTKMPAAAFQLPPAMAAQQPTDTLGLLRGQESQINLMPQKWRDGWAFFFLWLIVSE